MVGIVEKVCTKCGQTKPLEAFARRSERRGGRVSRCKACASAENKTWRELQLAKHGYKQPWRNVPRLDGMKVCRTCLEAKPLEEFTTRTGLEAHYYTPEIGREKHLRRKYGIGVEEYEALARAQGGVCAICNEFTPTVTHPTLVVDHDHETGAVRGLLCHSCNVAIGHMRESVEMLQRAIAYLQEGAR